MKIFDLDSPLMNVLNKMADLMWLNILTLICCIPVITAGAALTSMHYVALKVSPYVSAFLHRGVWSLRLRWMWRYKTWLHIVADQSVGIVDTRFFDKRGKQLL